MGVENNVELKPQTTTSETSEATEKKKVNWGKIALFGGLGVLALGAGAALFSGKNNSNSSLFGGGMNCCNNLGMNSFYPMDNFYNDDLMYRYMMNDSAMHSQNSWGMNILDMMKDFDFDKLLNKQPDDVQVLEDTPTNIAKKVLGEHVADKDEVAQAAKDLYEEALTEEVSEKYGFEDGQTKMTFEEYKEINLKDNHTEAEEQKMDNFLKHLDFLGGEDGKGDGYISIDELNSYYAIADAADGTTKDAADAYIKGYALKDYREVLESDDIGKLGAGLKKAYETYFDS